MNTILSNAIQSIFERAKKLSQVAFRRTQDVLKQIVIFVVIVTVCVLYVWGIVAIWPSGFFDTPFAYMTPAMLIRAGVAAVGVLGILLVGCLLVYLLPES